MTQQRVASIFRHTLLEDAASQIGFFRTEEGRPRACQTSIHNLDTAPPYRAISYTWGDPANPQTIHLDGRPFAVRKNCVCAISQARRYFAAGSCIWLDAICINQDDLDERSAQVARCSSKRTRSSSLWASVPTIAIGSTISRLTYNG